MDFILECSQKIPKNICIELIRLFENSVHLHKNGLTIGGSNNDVKKSVDIPIDPSFLKDSQWKISIENIIFYLKKGTDEYVSKFPYLKEIAEWGIDHKFNFQRYFPSDGYYKLHCEVPSKDYSHRILSWIIYLNNVDSAGTYFSHQNKTEEAEEGKIIIFPAYWTHPHKGIISKTQTKYILTGWFVYV
jgi:hypothetical protein